MEALKTHVTDTVRVHYSKQPIIEELNAQQPQFYDIEMTLGEMISQRDVIFYLDK